jgi:hypothetical protein
MDVNQLGSPRVRLVGSLLYATAACVIAWTMLRKSAAAVPLLMIALGLPLILRIVPRNWLYGMRSPRTLWTTEEIWYRQNVITGVALVLAGLVWMGVLAVRGLL